MYKHIQDVYTGHAHTSSLTCAVALLLPHVQLCRERADITSALLPRAQATSGPSCGDDGPQTWSPHHQTYGSHGPLPLSLPLPLPLPFPADDDDADAAAADDDDDMITSL